jgi:hypothetical protein
MRGLKHDRSVTIVVAGHALIQNLRQGRYELAVRRCGYCARLLRRPPSGIVGFLLFLPDWCETAADMPIQLTLLQGGSSAFQTGPIAP